MRWNGHCFHYSPKEAPFFPAVETAATRAQNLPPQVQEIVLS